jgi:hypothetical protein
MQICASFKFFMFIKFDNVVLVIKLMRSSFAVRNSRRSQQPNSHINTTFYYRFPFFLLNLCSKSFKKNERLFCILAKKIIIHYYLYCISYKAYMLRK